MLRLLLLIMFGSLALLLLPDLPGDVDIVLRGGWLLLVTLVLIWQLARLIIDNLHMLCAQLGWRTAKAPPHYIKALFDDYAERFDQHLMVELAYAAPNLVRRIVGQRLDLTDPIVVDLGCGTGICGPLFRTLAARLIGVDLAPAMLAQARHKNTYDLLVEEDLVRFLGRHQEAFDLCIAADVFVYMGDLRPAFSTTARALRPGGYLAFTIESSTDQPDWVLRRTGRYAHSHGYIEELAQACGLVIKAFDKATLRTQSDQPVIGEVWLLQRAILKT